MRSRGGWLIAAFVVCLAIFGCSRPPSHTELADRVREGVAKIPSVENSDVAWKRAGFDQTVTIRLTVDADDAGTARKTAEAALDVIAEAAREARGNGRIELKIYYAEGSQVLDAYQEGLPSRFDQLENR